MKKNWFVFEAIWLGLVSEERGRNFNLATKSVDVGGLLGWNVLETRVRVSEVSGGFDVNALSVVRSAAVDGKGRQGDFRDRLLIRIRGARCFHQHGSGDGVQRQRIAVPDQSLGRGADKPDSSRNATRIRTGVWHQQKCW